MSKPHRPVYTPATKSSVALLSAQCLAAPHIAQALHISLDTVYAILDDLAAEAIGQSDAPPDKRLPVVNLSMEYLPESGHLAVTLNLDGVMPTSVEWLASKLARFLQEQIDSF